MKRFAIAMVLGAFMAAPVWASNWPSGPHYNLSILGGPSCGAVPSGSGGGGRKTIFVPLVTKGDSPGGGEPESTSPDATDTSIYLIQGPTFAVCNGDACTQAVDCSGNSLGGKTGAVFELPCDVLSATGTTDNTCTQASTNSATYCVYAEALGTPGGNADITTCATGTDNTEVCSTNNAVLIRDKGGPKVQNVTDALTTLTCSAGTAGCPCSSGTCTYEIFNSNFQDFLWDYDNNGLKNAQIRFYLEPVGTTSCPT